MPIVLLGALVLGGLYLLGHSKHPPPPDGSAPPTGYTGPNYSGVIKRPSGRVYTVWTWKNISNPLSSFIVARLAGSTAWIGVTATANTQGGSFVYSPSSSNVQNDPTLLNLLKTDWVS